MSVALTAACGSESGAADTPATPAVDLAALDVGGFTTQPKPYGKVNSIELAKLVEAERMANHLPLPQEIMPEAKYGPSAMGGAIRPFIDFSSAAVQSRANADPAAMHAAAPGFVSGFVTTGRSDAVANLSYELDNLVMIFSDEKSASDAATALGQLDLAAVPENQPVQLPDYPNAVAYTTDHPLSGPGQIRSWYATGKFVIFSYVYDSIMSELKEADQAKLVERVQRSISTISPRVAKFQPTPVDQLMNLDTDMDGVLARALSTVVDDQSQRGIPGVYDRQGGLHISPAPEIDKPLFEATGVDRVAWRGNWVYRTQDPDAAARFVEERSETTRRITRVESPKGLPNAQCRKLLGASKYEIAYYCYVAYDRYAAEVAANQLADAQQRISAQYALLANSK
ncbi:hypothetical protein [Nocardia sp. NPDC050406]|uniref:DUF7373 family lipoprotein n=1 Tax=Nocardia sp. NPDC050406 TaxID=3364318 RepID=UPI00378E2C19